MSKRLVNMTFRRGESLEKWLPDMDSNHDKQIQNLLCYHYTIGQTMVLKANLNSFRVKFPQNQRQNWAYNPGPVCEGFPALKSGFPTMERRDN